VSSMFLTVSQLGVGMSAGPEESLNSTELSVEMQMTI